MTGFSRCAFFLLYGEWARSRTHCRIKSVSWRASDWARSAVKDKASVSHNAVIVKKLRKDRAFAAEYLRAAMEDREEPRVLLVALRQIAEARGGISKVAKAAGVERESLYRTLSPCGNPRLSTLFAVTRAMGLTLTVETARPIHR